jgi:hypothetical protein
MAGGATADDDNIKIPLHERILRRLFLVAVTVP